VTNQPSAFVEGALDLSPGLLRSIDERAPFPWHRYEAFVKPALFARLAAEFPGVEHFRHTVGQQRMDGRRPHDRHLLNWSEELHPHLPPVWQAFLEELQSETFTKYLATALGEKPTRVRFDWHRSYRGCEVSPHPDAANKVGTMVFYFNTRGDWDEAYGGDTLLLGGLRRETNKPELDDFSSVTPVPMLATQCFFFRRSDHSWHAVAPLTAPEGFFRNTFHAIAER
jgi:hypothetical protein